MTDQTNIWKLLLVAIQAGNLEEVMELRKSLVPDLTPFGYGDDVPGMQMSCAIYNKHLHIIKYFIEEQDFSVGQFDLTEAVRSEDIQIVKYLLSKGPDPNGYDKNAIRAASSIDMLKILALHKGDKGLIHEIVWNLTSHKEFKDIVANRFDESLASEPVH